MSNVVIKNDKQLQASLEYVWRDAIINRDAYIFLITNIMVNTIEELVYEKYNPTLYRRRFDGMNGSFGYGFAHKRSQVVQFNVPMTEIEIFNSAKGQKYDSISQTYTQTDVRLQPIIESGQGYSWRKSAIYKSKLARPFSPSVMAKLQETMPQVVTNRRLNNTNNKVIRDDYLPF